MPSNGGLPGAFRTYCTQDVFKARNAELKQANQPNYKGPPDPCFKMDGDPARCTKGKVTVGSKSYLQKNYPDKVLSSDRTHLAIEWHVTAVRAYAVGMDRPDFLIEHNAEYGIPPYAEEGAPGYAMWEDFEKRLTVICQRRKVQARSTQLPVRAPHEPNVRSALMGCPRYGCAGRQQAAESHGPAGAQEADLGARGGGGVRPGAGRPSGRAPP